MPLTDKYRPEKFEDIKGQCIAIERLKRFIQRFPEKKALILSGPPGCGKTCLAHVLAKETDSEILELNASDLRNREEIQKILGQASQQRSLFGQKKKILLVDEVDGITKDDRGGVQELISLIQTTKFPIIITANDIWDRKFSQLRRKTEHLQLKELDYATILQILKNISEKESLNISENLIKSIAIKAKGDARAAINDLQTIDQETLHEQIHERDKAENIFNTLKQIFQQLPNKETLFAYDKVNMSLDEIFLWLEENIPLEYKGEELYRAFEAISKADVFRGRIHRQQHWRFLVYQNFLLSVGISSAKKQVKTGFMKYKKPSRILKIWLINQRNKYKKTISEKFAKYCHINLKRAMRDFWIIKQILKNPRAQQEIKLDEKEIMFLTNSV